MANTGDHNKHRATATILAALRYWQQDLDQQENAVEDIIDNEHFQDDDPLVSVSHLNSMNLVFSKGRDHGFCGRIFNQAVVIRDSIEVTPDGKIVYGTCFTPQDGNSLLTSVATVLWFLDPETWQGKMSIFDGYLDRFRTIQA